MKIYLTSLIITLALNASSQDFITDYSAFIQSASGNRYIECIDRGTQLLKITRHPNIIYKVAECYCQADSAAQSLKLLHELAVKGLPYNVTENKKLVKITGQNDFKNLATKFEANRKSIQNSEDAFTLDDARLIPEGITATSDGRRFFTGSLAQNKIVEHAIPGGQKDLVHSGQYGIWSVLGMKVSADNKSLWLCSATEKDSLNGYSGIFGIDLASGTLINRHILDNKTTHHLFNDLVIVADSLLYFTDSKGGKVWKLNLADNLLIPVTTGNLIYPNGIAWNEKTANLYVADFTGIKRINLQNNTVSPLETKVPTYLNQVDGLYFYNNSLIAIQDSGNGDDRVVRLYLDKSGQTIVRVQVLQSFHPDFIIPTTGVIVKNEFYYISNSQLRNLRPDGSLTDIEQLKKPLIKKIRLN